MPRGISSGSGSRGSIRQRHALTGCRGALLSAVLLAASAQPAALLSQGVSTGTIRGTVRNETGAALDGALVSVRNLSTGRSRDIRVVDGQFLLLGAEIGGPYVIEARHIGFAPRRTQPLQLTLADPVEVEIVLRDPLPLAAVQVLAFASADAAAATASGRTTVSDSLLDRLPSFNRNFLDFVTLAPQVSARIGGQRNGFSAAGANFRYNTYLVDGAEERFVNSNVSAAHVGRSVPLDAVREYQVLVAPYDVRYGDFAGALVNTVTRSGTNDYHGSAFSYWRSNRLTRFGSVAVDSLTYERWQYGFSLGGPIVRDRVHFFLAPEFQSLASPAAGPFVGQPADATPSLPIDEAVISRFSNALRGYGLTPGNGGLVRERSPLQNLFARVDADFPRARTHATASFSYAGAEESSFSRADTFFLSSAEQTAATTLRVASLRLNTSGLGRAGANNELLLSHSADHAEQRPAVRQPLIRVLVPGSSGAMTPLVAGAREVAHGRYRAAEALRIQNIMSVMMSRRHLLTIGVSAEQFRIKPSGVTGGYGVWTFRSLDDLENGIAESYELRKDLGSASVAMRGSQFAAFIGDEWRPGDRLILTLGLRGDVLAVRSKAPYNATVESTFGRRTDTRPRPSIHLSPRLGFSWKPDGAERDELRGGVGVFTGRPPLAWLHSAVMSHGVGIGLVRCGFLPGDEGPPPAFQPDYRAAPQACASGPRPITTMRGEVNLLDHDLRMAQAVRASIAWDRKMWWNLRSTTELLLTRYDSDYLFVNLNLEGPQGVDGYGRVMYGTIAPSGIATAAVRTNQFTEVIDLRNTSLNRAFQFSTRLQKEFDRGFAAMLSYTFSRVRDVQSPNRVNQRGLVTWADARAASGRHENPVRGVSLNDVPHRVVAYATYSAPWTRWPTVVSLSYAGESGTPFTYLAYGELRRGDLNADGSNLNDPIYVPLDVLDPAEIRFDGTSSASGADNSADAQAVRVRTQQAAFIDFVDSTSCLRRQRGRIVERNSCREPWSNTTVASLRQALPLPRHRVEMQLDVFNVLNLLNPAWGRYRVTSPLLLQHTGQTPATLITTQPVFRFDPSRPRTTDLAMESAYQLQLALRLSF